MTEQQLSRLRELVADVKLMAAEIQEILNSAPSDVAAAPVEITLVRFTGSDNQRSMDGTSTKILAIKALRELTGMGLKETKEMVETGGTFRVSPHLHVDHWKRLISDAKHAGCVFKNGP